VTQNSVGLGGGGNFSFRNCTICASLFERRAVGEQDTPNHVKRLVGKRFWLASF
jgi:hypothetical protein